MYLHVLHALAQVPACSCDIRIERRGLLRRQARLGIVEEQALRRSQEIVDEPRDYEFAVPREVKKTVQG